MRILFAEDGCLYRPGFRRAWACRRRRGTGQDGLFLATGVNSQNVLVVDRMLPGLDGLGLAQAGREGVVKVPVLFRKVLGGVEGRVRGLEAGCGDYLAKLFSFAELTTRVQAPARSLPLSDVPARLGFGDHELGLSERTVTRSSERIDLQPHDSRLPEVLLRHADRVVNHRALPEEERDSHIDPNTDIAETLMGRLRAKLSRGGQDPELIHTARYSGYVLRLLGV